MLQAETGAENWTLQTSKSRAEHCRRTFSFPDQSRLIISQFALVMYTQIKTNKRIHQSECFLNVKRLNWFPAAERKLFDSDWVKRGFVLRLTRRQHTTTFGSLSCFTECVCTVSNRTCAPRNQAEQAAEHALCHLLLVHWPHPSETAAEMKLQLEIH